MEGVDLKKKMDPFHLTTKQDVFKKRQNKKNYNVIIFKTKYKQSFYLWIHKQEKVFSSSLVHKQNTLVHSESYMTSWNMRRTHDKHVVWQQIQEEVLLDY